MNSERSRPLDAPRLFLDRDIWSHVLDDALKNAGIDYVAHRERFLPETPDSELLAEAGKQGWIVLTRDQRIRYRPNELNAVIAARVVLFVLTQGNLSAAETARIVVGAYPRIIKKAREAVAPAIYTLVTSGKIGRMRLGR